MSCTKGLGSVREVTPSRKFLENASIKQSSIFLIHHVYIYIYVAHDILSFFEKNHLIQTSSEINGPNIFGVAVPLEVKNLIKMPKETSANHQRISTIHESHPFLWILVNV